MNEDTYLKSTSFIAFTVLHTCYRNSLIKITPKILIDELKSGVQALLAQWIARWTSNPKVVGSSPTQGILLYRAWFIMKEFYLQCKNVQNTSSFYGVFISIT